FNPLENVNVFSNDASQLLPESALASSGGQTSYLVEGWPQTIAPSSVPSQNFGVDLRAFLASVGTRPDTQVHIQTTARVIAGGPLPSGLDVRASADFVPQPYEVLNLETSELTAAFTGTPVTAN